MSTNKNTDLISVGFGFTIAVVVFIVVCMVLYSKTSYASNTRSFCVFDPIGANGPLFQIMKEDVVPALKWGVKLDLEPYTDEKIAAADFKAGQCDMVLIAGALARDFNQFTGTIEAVGALPTLDETRSLLQVLSTPKAVPHLTQGNTEVIGILPAGPVRLFMRDREVDSVEELQGLKFGTMDHDKAAMAMVRKVGASVVPVSVSTFAGKFNNGSVDVIYAPVVAYEPLELYKGVGTTGSIYKYAVAQMTFQILARADRFDDSFKQQYREYTFGKFDKALKIISDAEDRIPATVWSSPSAEQARGYDLMLRDARIELREAGVYNSKALTLMRKIRCAHDSTKAECVEQVE